MFNYPLVFIAIWLFPVIFFIALPLIMLVLHLLFRLVGSPFTRNSAMLPSKPAYSNG